MAVGRDGKGWGEGVGVGKVTLCHSAGEVHTDLLAFASLQGIPRGLQLLPPVLRLRPGKRHHHILCTLVDGVLGQLAELAADHPRVGAQELLLAGRQVGAHLPQHEQHSDLLLNVHLLRTLPGGPLAVHALASSGDSCFWKSPSGKQVLNCDGQVVAGEKEEGAALAGLL